MSSKQISITIQAETLKKLDLERGITKRSSIIEYLISQYLEKSEGKNPPAKDPKTTNHGDSK